MEHGCTVGHECIVEHGYVKIIAGETLTRERTSSVDRRATIPQRNLDEISLERRVSWSTVRHCETLRSTIKHGCVKIIVGESLTRELLSSVEQP